MGLGIGVRLAALRLSCLEALLEQRHLVRGRVGIGIRGRGRGRGRGRARVGSSSATSKLALPAAEANDLLPG